MVNTSLKLGTRATALNRMGKKLELGRLQRDAELNDYAGLNSSGGGNQTCSSALVPSSKYKILAREGNQLQGWGSPADSAVLIK